MKEKTLYDLKKSRIKGNLKIYKKIRRDVNIQLYKQMIPDKISVSLCCLTFISGLSFFGLGNNLVEDFKNMQNYLYAGGVFQIALSSIPGAIAILDYKKRLASAERKELIKKLKSIKNKCDLLIQLTKIPLEKENKGIKK